MSLENPRPEQEPSNRDQEKKKIALVDITADRDTRARDMQEAAMAETGSGFGWFLKKIWKHNLARDYYRQKELYLAKKKLESGTIYGEDVTDKAAQEAAEKSIIDQFTSEYAESIHVAAGEKREKLGETEKDKVVQKQVLNFVKSFATQDLANPDVLSSFQEEKNRLLSSVTGAKRDVVDKGARYADNLFEVVKQVKQNIENGKSLDALDKEFEIVVGQARSGVRTEAHLTKLDSVIDKIQRSAVGRFIGNEFAIAASVSMAYSLTVGLSQRMARSALFATTSFFGTALMAGGIAGLRERVRFKQERAQHERERATGKTFEAGDTRREEMEKFRHETKDATQLSNALEQSIFRIDKDGRREVRDLTPEELQIALGNLADIDSRIRLSDEQKIDLISFTDVKNVGRERLRLDLLRADAKVALRKLLGKEIKAETSGQPFEYKIDGLVPTAEIDKFMKSPDFTGASDELDRKNKLAYWLAERRMATGFTVPEIEQVHGTFNQNAAEEYDKWTYIRAEEILSAWADSQKKGERIIGADLKLPDGKDFDTYLQELTATQVMELIKGEQGIEKQNAIFNKMLRKRVAGAVLKGMLSGVIIGGLVQEAGAFLRSGQEGLIEGLVKGQKEGFAGTANLTPLEYLRRLMTGNLPRMEAGSVHEMVLGNTHIKVPEGVDLIKNSDGSLKLMRSGEVLQDNLTLDKSQHFSAASREALKKIGILSNESVVETTTQSQVDVSKSPAAFIGEHEGVFHKIKRTLWYDNDTPKPVFDKNELKLWWGGEQGTGLDANGNFVYNIKQMMPDGSYHGKLSANAQKLMGEGKLKLLLSLSRDTQNQVFEVPIDARGNAVVDPNSEIGKLFFASAGGRAKFLGKFAEVAEVMGKTTDGAEKFRILATDVGKGVEAISGKRLIQETTKNFFETLDVPADFRIEPPPIVPIFGRQPLEPAKEREMISYLYDYSRGDPDRERYYRETRSEALIENPDAQLDHYQEIKSYLEKQSPDYSKTLKNLSEQAGPMSADCRLSICIPVAEHQEGETIYKTLESYKYQSADKKNFEIVLFVNQPDVDKSGKKVKPDKTAAEIKRFQRDNPDMPIRVMSQIISRDQARIGNIRKILNDSVLQRHHERGANIPDLIMVSNDADCRGLAPDYVANFLKKFELNPQTDAFLGQVDWDPEAYIRNPLVHVGTRLFQYIEVQSRAYGWHIGSSGANFAFRSSIYAGVGGYSSDKAGGEDTDFGAKILSARAGGKENTGIDFAGAGASRVFTSARRAERGIHEGLAPIEQWDKGFSAFDDEVRKIKWEKFGQKVNYENPKEVADFITALQTTINRTIARTKSWGGTVHSSTLTRALGWLGVKYEVVDSYSIKITNADRLIAGLKRYQADGQEMFDRKSGRNKR